MAAKALPITKRVEIINKRKFAVAALNADDKTFVIYVVALVEPTTMPIHSSCQAQVTALTSEESGISAEYPNFSDIFSSDFAVELSEYTGINDYFINLLDDKQLLYSPRYRLRLVKLKTLKTYIKANLASSFIILSKFPANTPILFGQKKDGSFRLCIDYHRLNNRTIKNHYPLPLIGESLNRLSCAKCFTQLDLINAYHRMRI